MNICVSITLNKTEKPEALKTVPGCYKKRSWMTYYKHINVCGC